MLLTAYEMRISNCSSDLCSSYLAATAPVFHEVLFAQGGQGFADGHGGDTELGGQVDLDGETFAVVEQAEVDGLGDAQDDFVGPADGGVGGDPGRQRSHHGPPLPSFARRAAM